MVTIVKASVNDAELLATIAQRSFIESHGHSAPKEDINNYIVQKYTTAAFVKELSDPHNIYHTILYNNVPAGYSAIQLNSPHAAIPSPNFTKLNRLYLLSEFYDLKLGSALLSFNIELSKANDQKGMWLYTWKENHRAVNFYSAKGFKIIGSFDFRLSETHTNPNHLMQLIY